MKTIALLAFAVLLAGCQTQGDRMAQLQQICADPGNRAAGSFYYQECQSLYPLTAQQRQQGEALARGVGAE
ncbi:hypothetical protein GCM10007036_43050 [Alsobacter metallidurans]|uniref:Lipoprotein n=1 Tax=Alsobacter metallidurans TaxID=340221 RepID=A0A917IBK7_9HYPH|nr:hypothetical protein [Alsobacter metallidurans]GGH31679.1 hypothetical protein GCM10007036_43050 [Alsobacter metallidurans]